MRTFSDRLRHTILFEAIAVALVAVGGGLITGHGMMSIGALTLMLSLVAMILNLVYNWLFDLWDRAYRAMARRGAGLRVVHAILFEAVMLVAGLFVTAWWLDLSYRDALMLDLGFAVFFLIYAFCFNWTYDVVFPVPRTA